MYTIKARLTNGGTIALSAETDAEALRKGAAIAATYLMGARDHKWQLIAAIGAGDYQEAIYEEQSRKPTIFSRGSSHLYNQAYIAPQYHITITEEDPMVPIKEWAHHIVEGTPVLVDDPNDGDTWNHSFIGTAVDMNVNDDLSINAIFILDGDGDTHMAYPWQVTPQEGL